jgi:hypothetical protein
MDIRVFHAYNNLVAAGKVKPLTCPDCDKGYVTRATIDGEPLLACTWCNTIVQPGYRLYQQIRAVVNEHSEKHV